jgi:PKHD-type hydroxylase
MINLTNMSWPFFFDHIENYVCWENAFSEEEIEKIINHCKTFELKKSKLINKNMNQEIRDSRSVFISPDGLEWAFVKLAEMCNQVNNNYFKFDIFGFMEGLQFTEYKEPNGHYKSHVDRVNRAQVRKLSIVLQLTNENEYEGGNLELILGDGTDTIKMSRKKGSLIIFPSYTLHRVTNVTSGKRHSLVGWITGKPFV